jgi:pimeloyl-ACP methyl ester carboxylesterase
MLHGSHLDPSIYIIASSIQHHPEPWPRRPAGGPVTSSNRSLAFALVNNGYDVWLIGGRGSSPPNSGWTPLPKKHRAKQPHFKPTKLMRSTSWLPQFWTYSLDDIIKYELANQIDLVRNLTGSREFHYFTFSLSTTTTMAFLGENPEYAKDCRTYTQMAPVIAASHFTHLGRIYWEKLVPHFSNKGIGFSPSFFFDDVILKRLVELVSQSDKLRYTIIYELYRTLFGPSAKYHTNLELNVLSHLFQPVSFKSVQQYGQSSAAQKFKYYNYGWFKNLLHYNDTREPEHKVDRLEVQNYLMISGSLDCLSDPYTVQRMKELTSSPKPITHIIAPGFNHIDLIAGVENDIYVNMPYIEYLDQHSDPPGASPTNKV